VARLCGRRNTAQAEASFQQGKSCELRTAMGLSDLEQQQGKGQEAHAWLAPIYG